MGCTVARPQMFGFRRDLFALVSHQSAAIFSSGVQNFVPNTHFMYWVAKALSNNKVCPLIDRVGQRTVTIRPFL